MKDVGNWKSFWELTTPEEAASRLRELYGAGAAKAAAECAQVAEADGRGEDHRFWVSTFALLGGPAH